MAASSRRSSPTWPGRRRARRGWSMRPGCWSSPAWSTSTPTRGSPRTPSRTGSSRIPWPPRTAARRRSCRSTTPERGRRRRPSDRCGPGWPEWRAATNADSAIDYGLSLAVSGHADDPLAELPATIEAGVATSKAFMVFDFRLPRPGAVRCDAAHGRARRHAPGPLRGSGAARRRRRRVVAAW